MTNNVQQNPGREATDLIIRLGSALNANPSILEAIHRPTSVVTAYADLLDFADRQLEARSEELNQTQETSR